MKHRNVLKYSERPFKDISEMNVKLLENINNSVEPGDEIYFLGDIGHSHKEVKLFFDNLKSGIGFHWIIGNHDKKLLTAAPKKRVSSISYIKEIYVEKKPIILCHYPMLTWDKSHYNSWHLFGHHHKNGHDKEGLESRLTGKMFNVNLEFNDYQMYSEKDIIRIMMAKENNWDFIKER